jgi:hypothetical protein
MKMKTYCGIRHPSNPYGRGKIVLVDGTPLDHRLNIRIYGTDFDWGCWWSDGSKQLAFALLVDHFETQDHPEAAVEAQCICEQFKWRVIATLPGNWQLTSADIREALDNINGGLGLDSVP